jgi:putative protease
MAKKKAKKKVKRSKAKKKKVVRKKKVRKVKAKRKKVVRKKVVKAKAKVKEKVLGVVDHFFGKISVAAIKVKAPIKVGDVIHIKGHTTDFTQKIDSMQIEHQNVLIAKNGDDIGIKVKEKVRDHDVVYLAESQKGILQKPILPAAAKPSAAPPSKPEKSNPYGNTRFLKF